MSELGRYCQKVDHTTDSAVSGQNPVPRLSPWRIAVALRGRIEESLARVARERHPRETFFDMG
jgi:hypothetical protein